MVNRFLTGRGALSWQDAQRWAIVAATLAAAAYLGRAPSEMRAIQLMGLIGLAVFLRWPWVGLVTLVAASLSVPFSLGTGTQTELNIAVLLTALLSGLLFLEIFGLRRTTFIHSRPMWPLLALCAATLLAFVAGLEPWHVFASDAPLPTQLGGVFVFLLSAAAFLLAAHQLKTLRQLQLLVWVFLGLGGLYIAGRFLSIPASIPWPGYPNGAAYSLFWVWLVALAFGQALFNRQLAWGWRLALAALALATLGIGWFQGRDWVSGWLPSLVAILTLTWLRSWRLGLALTAIVAAYFLWLDPSASTAVVSEEDYSIMTRDVARDILVKEVWPLSPILGLGPANYYWYVPLFPILGYAVKFNSHNNYVDILLQTGLLGMLCFVWLMAETGWLGWRLSRSVRDDFARGFVNGVLAGLVGTLLAAWLGDWLLPFVYNIGLTGFRSSVLAWLFLGALVALEQLHRRGEV